jgi:carboxylesterase
MPYHGYTDRMRTEQSQLTAEELVAYSNEVADIAQGLGNETTVAGFSAGGVLAAWLAQNRADIDQVVLISPVLGLASVPMSLTEFAAKILLTLPDFYVWWNPAVKEDLPGLGGPRFSSHALAQLLRLSESVQQQAAQNPPQVNEVLTITNEFDFGVSREEVEDLLTQWAQQGASVETYTIPWENLWQHDFIDPNVPENQPDVVNPMLVDLITGQAQQ